MNVLSVGAIHESPAANKFPPHVRLCVIPSVSERNKTKKFDRATNASSRGIYEGFLLSQKKVTSIPKAIKTPNEIPLRAFAPFVPHYAKVRLGVPPSLRMTHRGSRVMNRSCAMNLSHRTNDQRTTFGFFACRGDSRIARRYQFPTARPSMRHSERQRAEWNEKIRFCYRRE